MNAPQTAQIWLVAYDAAADIEPAAGWRLPTDADQQRLERKRRGDTRTQFALGRLLAHSALEATWGRQSHQWRIDYDERGRPLVSNHPGRPPAISISHTAGLVAVALAPSESLIGVDVEDSRRNMDIDTLSDQVFSPEEDAEYRRTADTRSRGAYFFGRWTLKEAYTKALGAGLYAPFPTIRFGLDSAGDAYLARCAEEDDSEPSSWCFLQRMVCGSFHLAAATTPLPGRAVHWARQTRPIVLQGNEHRAEIFTAAA